MAATMSIILRLELDREKGSFGEVATAVTRAGGDIVAIDVIKEAKQKTTRDVTVRVNGQAHADEVVQTVRDIQYVSVVHVSDRTFLVHLGGKIEMRPKVPINNREDLSRVYTPEVARISQAIYENPDLAHTLTIKRNTVAVVSDGSAVLGLGNIGAAAAMPVMEGKAMLFKQLGQIDAMPVCLDTQDTEELILIIKAMAPTYGGINLEDIASPRCFEIENRLTEELDIPVFHDDQHGTAVVIMAGLLNALKLVKKDIKDIKVVVCGIGAAGIASTKMLLNAGITNVIGVDKEGAITKGKSYAHSMWDWYAEHTNPHQEKGALSDVLEGADVFIGVSAPNILTVDDLKKMNKDPIVFAMANPNPEISPELAEPHVRVLATGRSDYPNQINNVLCFPGIFRGALDCRATTITENMKLAAAKAIADSIGEDELNEDYIIPSVFNKEVVKNVSAAVAEAANKDGVARKL
ncbi:NAD-dependent malic enzyme [Aureibacillus halotolerans]|uniref:Malate dehydrogenase (Oxaloacetate-decarboxylating) n=1 Tax=Aureibacillus halotolerans TaxID=1508390 RepID=A0A4R6TZ84_9BACI|nr:NAD-dependent malic enzyme [Aureibacillus halotolerans]TDQ37379.1 malate dehydrogenase (oxaloacetate-decarboxylating) [Aureibacillus halotolerans]